MSSWFILGKLQIQQPSLSLQFLALINAIISMIAFFFKITWLSNLSMGLVVQRFNHICKKSSYRASKSLKYPFKKPVSEKYKGGANQKNKQLQVLPFNWSIKPGDKKLARVLKSSCGPLLTIFHTFQYNRLPSECFALVTLFFVPTWCFVKSQTMWKKKKKDVKLHSSDLLPNGPSGVQW